MKKYHSVFSLLPSLFCFCISNSYASEAANPGFSIEEIADGLYVHQGVHVTFDDPQHDDIANIGFIIGDKCIAVIDTSGSVHIAKQLNQAIKTISDKPVCYVINTHVHFDHVLGNIVFKESGAEFIGHTNLPAYIDSNRDFFMTEFKNDLGEFARAENIIAPTIIVEDTMEIDLGNRIIQLKAWPSAHSDADLTVFDSKTNSIWLSDLLFIERIPSFDGSLKGWLKVMEKIEQEQYSYLIPGHGPVTQSTDGLKAQKDYLSLLLNDIRKRLAEGAFMEEIVADVGKDEKLNWLLHEQHHRPNVTRAFSELEWE